MLWQDTFKPSVIEQAKRSVVSVDVQVAFAPYDVRTQWSRNGVVIDKQAGYILTSGLTVGPIVVAKYTIGFFNGTETQAKVIYYDPWLDYAILEVDPRVIPKEIRAVKLSHKNPLVGQSVFTIDREKQKVATLYSGSISDTNYIAIWSMHHHFIRVSMSTKGCIEGSLIFNEAGEGIALNCASSDTANFGLHLNYIHYALSALKQQKIPVRKHIGALLATYSLDDCGLL